MAESTTNQAGSAVEGQETDADILSEARDRYRMCQDYESDNQTAALDDLLFLTGGLNQWEPEAARIRTAEKRPCLTVNNLPTFLHQVTNEQRMNTPAIKVHPESEDSDDETAEVLQDVIRHIEYDSNADIAQDRAVNSAASVGFGYFRFITEYESEDSFDQKIMYKSIRNALSVHIDPLSQEPDGSDMKYCFIDSLEPRKEFEKQYPDANASNTSLIGQQIYLGWFTEDTVLICEYYRIKEVEESLCLMADGSTAWKAELPPGAMPYIKKERKSYRCVVEWFKITGADVLERTIIKCKWIPVFPVYGDEVDIEGKVVRSGIIRNAKDPFKMYNYWITCATEEVSLRPKTPFIGAVGQFETAKDQWATANSVSYAYLEYDPISVDGVLTPQPSRSQMADVPVGALAMLAHAADNKKATTGLFDSSLGARGTATSGVQEREQQQQADVSNFHYADNLNKTTKHAGRCLVSMIPHYYDAARIVTMMGEDGSVKTVPVNQEYQRKNDKTGQIETVMHDLTKGRYGVTVSTGPSFASKRQEAAQFMTEAIQGAKDPAAANVLTYLAIKNQDIPGADEATKMLKKLLPPGLAEPEEGEEPVVDTPEGPVPVSQVGGVIQKMGMALQNASAQMDEAAMTKEKNRSEELGIRKDEIMIKAYQARTERLKADADMLTAKAKDQSSAENINKVAGQVAEDVVDATLQISAAREAEGIMADDDLGGMGDTLPAIQPPVAPIEQPGGGI